MDLLHALWLQALTGIVAGENQARRLLHDIRRYGTTLEQRTGKRAMIYMQDWYWHAYFGSKSADLTAYLLWAAGDPPPGPKSPPEESAPASVQPGPASKLLVALALGAVYLIWSGTYLALRFVVKELPTMLTVGLRALALDDMEANPVRVHLEMAPRTVDPDDRRIGWRHYQPEVSLEAERAVI